MSSTLMGKLVFAFIKVFIILAILYVLCYVIRFIAEGIQKMIGTKKDTVSAPVAKASGSRGNSETRTIATIVSGIIAREKGDFKNLMSKA